MSKKSGRTPMKGGSLHSAEYRQSVLVGAWILEYGPSNSHRLCRWWSIQW